MCNLRVESDKLLDKSFNRVYSIIIDEYQSGKLHTYGCDHMMFAYFFRLRLPQKIKHI